MVEFEPIQHVKKGAFSVPMLSVGSTFAVDPWRLSASVTLVASSVTDAQEAGTEADL
ncbi:MAG TPA: hypothetical protein VKY38_09910 [Azoarcus sp.]|nr:hypothetical protein [Azoarcus sp.]